MPQSSQNKIRPKLILIIHIALKRRWIIIVPFFLSVIVGVCLAIVLPKTYQASTTIMVQAQRVPDSYVQSVVSSDISSRLNTIVQQIMSRTNIERIIEEFDLFSGPKYENMFSEDKIADVRNHIVVNINQSISNNELNTFSISFRGKEPQKVKEIVNTLANYFIDENLKVREAQATGTLNFLDDELETIHQRLEKSELEYHEYLQKYKEGLPEQLDANRNILDRLRRDYDNLKDTYDSLYTRRLEAEISVNMEKKQKGEQFQIIDLARLPEKPVAPNMKKLFLVAILLGLGIGGGIVFLLEFMNK